VDVYWTLTDEIALDIGGFTSSGVPASCVHSSNDREYVALPEQHAAAGRALTGKLAGHQPSINCPHIHAAQMSDLPFRQKLLVIGSIHMP
jgi:hypothetical protein